MLPLPHLLYIGLRLAKLMLVGALVTRAMLRTSLKVCSLPLSLFFFLLGCADRSPSPDVADIISTVEFDHTGNYLATGDKGGRVVLFERNETVCSSSQLPT